MVGRTMLLWSVCWLSACAAPGCATNPFMARNEQTEPPTVEDKWAIVGREGRGNRKVEKEDPLDRFLMSDKAREINRNVGFE